jgi:hypothetical protein
MLSDQRMALQALGLWPFSQAQRDEQLLDIRVQLSADPGRLNGQSGR